MEFIYTIMVSFFVPVSVSYVDESKHNRLKDGPYFLQVKVKSITGSIHNSQYDFDNHIIKELVHMRRDFFWEEYESFESYSVIIFVIYSKLKHIRNHSRIILSKYAIYYYYVFKRQAKIMTTLVVKDCNDV